VTLATDPYVEGVHAHKGGLESTTTDPGEEASSGSTFSKMFKFGNRSSSVFMECTRMLDQEQYRANNLRHPALSKNG